MDDITKSWIRNASDERAVQQGCWFDLEAGAYVVWWIERFCRLYEGEWAGEPLRLRGMHDEDWQPILDDWEYGGREKSIQRARGYMEAYGSNLEGWQYECTMRVFGWLRDSSRWGRPIRRFRKVGVWIPKKSGKTPSMAGWGVYLLAGDGESGQKVFLAAKDGYQADIAGKHAIEMIYASPELNSECVINKNLRQITHNPTSSILRPLSSANTTTQQSKEGLNGSILVDETHVVDREFMNRISRAGISRSEPLHAEFSTAGKDPDSYGRERWEYGRDVANGDVDDIYTFWIDYSAPAELNDMELAADPIKYGKMANPAWGHTVGEEEYLADYKESARTPRTLAEFKMYRLNIWQRTADPWIPGDAWDACQESFTEEDLHGQACGGGLDLAKSQDLVSLVLAFPKRPEEWIGVSEQEYEQKEHEDHAIRILAWHWVPRAVVEAQSGRVDYPTWARDGWIRLIDGAVNDYMQIESDIVQILKRFECRLMAYDPYYATQSIQRFQNLGIMRQDQFYEFPQTITRFAGPSAMFERLVLAHKLHHHGNPLLTWQAGHVTVKSDLNDNIRPVKPPRADHRKIDGIVASIMALDAVVRMPKARRRSFYETHAVEFAG